MKKYLFNFLYLLPLCLLLFSCEEPETENPEAVSFKNFGLQNRIVHELTVKNKKLYAATDNGLFSRDLSNNSDWQALGLQGKNTKTIVFTPDGTCLVSVVNQANSEYKLYKSQNNSDTFQQVTTNFGGETPEPINSLTYNQATDEALAVGFGVIAKSTDKGTTWTPIYNDWHRFGSGLDFVQVNLQNRDIWAGGQNGIEGFVLIKYSKEKNNWQNWINLIESPSTAKDIAFDKNNPNRLIVGGEDGILKTEDNGTTWTLIKNEHHSARFYFGVDFDQENSNRIYAASWQKNFDNPQPLVFYISEDAGATWQEYRYKDENIFGGVWDMVQVKSGGKTKLYLGLYKGGVFEVTVNK